MCEFRQRRRKYRAVTFKNSSLPGAKASADLHRHKAEWKKSGRALHGARSRVSVNARSRSYAAANWSYDKAMAVLKLRRATPAGKGRSGSCEGAKPYGFKIGESDVLEQDAAQAEHGCIVPGDRVSVERCGDLAAAWVEVGSTLPAATHGTEYETRTGSPPSGSEVQRTLRSDALLQLFATGIPRRGRPRKGPL